MLSLPSYSQQILDYVNTSYMALKLRYAGEMFVAAIVDVQDTQISKTPAILLHGMTINGLHTQICNISH